MTTSGVTTFSVTRDDLIRSILRALGVISEGFTPSAQMMSDTNQAMNMLIKAWMARGVGLWLNQIATIPLVVNQQSYLLGPGGTPPASRPLGVMEMRLRDASGIDTPLIEMSRQEYMDLPLKSSAGNPTQFYYDPQTGNGVLYIWPVASDATDRLVGTLRMPVQDFVNIADTPDFPQEWFRALKFNTAKELLTEYTVPPATVQLIMALAQEAFDEANLFDRETAPTRFAPDLR
jgi:hypothetical protein